MPVGYLGNFNKTSLYKNRLTDGLHNDCKEGKKVNQIGTDDLNDYVSDTWKLHEKPRKRPRKLKVLKSETYHNSRINDNEGENDKNSNILVEWDDHFDFLSAWNRSISMPVNSRPLPSVMQILAVTPQQAHHPQKVDNDDNGTQNNHELLPSTNGTINSTKLPPLLQNYFKKHRLNTNDVEEHQDENEELCQINQPDNSVSDHSVPQDETDETHPQNNSLKSTLTQNQHLRYSQLLSEYRSRKKMPSVLFRKEFKAVSSAFKQERFLYIEALRQYQINNKDRFLLGYRVQGPASEHAMTKSKLIQAYRMSWLNSSLPIKFGKCYQEISVKSTCVTLDPSIFEISNIVNIISKAEQSENWTSHSTKWMGTNSFSRVEVVGQDTAIDLPTTSRSCLAQMKGLKLTAPQEVATYTFLVDDKEAKRLAVKHNVDLIVTAEAMESFLQRPAKDRTKWKVPVFSGVLSDDLSLLSRDDSSKKNLSAFKTMSKRITFVESPIPSPSNPRESLTQGIEESLYHSLILQSPGSSNKKRYQNVYTLLTIPSNSTSSSQKSCCVLVRSKNHVVETDDDCNERNYPIQLLTQLEYFSEHGMEELSSHEKSIAILRKFIQPKSKVFLTRVDPKHTTVLHAEELFTELMLGCGNTYDVNILQNGCRTDLNKNFKTMIDILVSIKQINLGWNVLTLPGVGVISSPWTTISVHAVEESGEQTSELVDIDHELSNADVVYLREDELMKCFKLNAWFSTRAIFTFPFKS